MRKTTALLALMFLILAAIHSALLGPVSPQLNNPPVADAGPDQTVNAGETVHFDGSGSYDPDGFLEVGTNIKVNDESGSDWQSNPSIGIDNSGNVFVAWEDYRNADLDIYFSRLPYGGTAFETNIRVNDDYGDWKQSRPSLAVGPGGEIHVAWEDNRNGNWDIYYANSTDGGLSFGTNVLITTVNTTDWQNNPSIAVDSSGTIYAAWEDDRDANWSIYYASSADDFGSNVKVNADLTTGNHWSPSLDVGDTGTVHIAWESMADIYHSRSTDGGSTFGPTQRVNDDIGVAFQGEASLAAESGGIVHMVWEDKRANNSDAYYSQSLDDGVSFAGNMKINDDVSGQGQASPWIAVEDGEFLHAIWADARGTDWDIFYSASFDGGLAWQPNAQINDDPRKASQTRPTVVAEDGGYFHAAWKDSRRQPSGLTYDVFYAKGKVTKLQYSWDFGDGSPPAAGVRPTHVYTTPGTYNVTLTVTDPEGAEGTDNCLITVIQANLAPVADANGPYEVDEGMPVTLDASGSYDPDGNPLEFRWDLDNDGVWDTGWSPSPYLNYTWGDDYTGHITVEVTDGVFTDTDTANITVNNVNPMADIVEAYVNVSFTLRVAGEKWHNVELYLYQDGVQIGYAEVVRYPGSPDDQSVTVADVKCDVTGRTSATVYYTPNDDPINGQINGANPGWIILNFEDGSNATLNQTFNVNHPDTWEWNVEISQHFVGHEITFEATASDPGSDDLTFTWDWGDSTPSDVMTYYNDGVGPDVYPSPDINPIAVTDIQKHTYTNAGTYTLVLHVTDDDHGTVQVSLDLNF
jgi:hypothetical protein